MITVELRNARFFGYHGLYPEERKTGNEFEISLAVGYEPAAETITDLSETVNYARLYEIVNKAMQEPVDLLETLAMSIADKVRAEFGFIKNIDISVSKLHPPISRFTGSVTICFQKTY